MYCAAVNFIINKFICQKTWTTFKTFVSAMTIYYLTAYVSIQTYIIISDYNIVAVSMSIIKHNRVSIM